MKIILVIYIAFFYTFDTVIESKMMFEDQVKSASMLNLDSAEQLTTEGCSDNQDCPDCDTDGEITTGHEYIDFNRTNWTFTNDKLYQTYLDKISGKIQNSDFYDESNENLGDLFLLNSVYDGERLEDFVFPDIQSDESKVSSVYEEIPEYWKSKITIEKYGNRNNDYRIR